MYVIHYFDLEDLIEALAPGLEIGASGVVHLEGVKTVIPGSIKGVAEARSAIHVRAVANGAIRVWMARIGSVQLAHGRPLGSEEKVAEVATRSAQARALVAKRLEEAGLTVRPGLIDIHPAEPVEGRWDGQSLDRILAGATIPNKSDPEGAADG